MLSPLSFITCSGDETYRSLDCRIEISTRGIVLLEVLVLLVVEFTKVSWYTDTTART